MAHRRLQQVERPRCARRESSGHDRQDFRETLRAVPVFQPTTSVGLGSAAQPSLACSRVHTPKVHGGLLLSSPFFAKVLSYFVTGWRRGVDAPQPLAPRVPYRSQRSRMTVLPAPAGSSLRLMECPLVHSDLLPGHEPASERGLQPAGPWDRRARSETPGPLVGPRFRRAEARAPVQGKFPRPCGRAHRP